MKNKRTKIYSMYLPQFHVIEENSKFWGEGFTDWVTVKKAEPLFEGHAQPKVPLNDNYYDLSEKRCLEEQVQIAKRYGVDGWGIYHYWFNNEQCLLTKPVELLLGDKTLNIPFFFAWDNASWKRTWSKLAGNDWSPIQDSENVQKREGPEILIEYKIGAEKDWEKHFNYLLPFFKDSRYIKHDKRPLFLIYNYSEKISQMVEYWEKLAKQNGFDGMEIIYSYNPFHGIPANVKKFTYEPLYSGWGSFSDRVLRLLGKKTEQKYVKKYDYDKVWKSIIKNAKYCHDKNRYYGAFVNYDDTPRRGKKGKVVLGGTPKKFEKYLNELIKVCEKQRKEYIFLTAWNEWGEGAVLEADKDNEYAYLRAYKRAKARR